MKIVSLFNNKGGVGKTTLASHATWVFAGGRQKGIYNEYSGISREM